MNVQLKYIDQGRRNLLETDKIVHVKVIERRGGNSAIIELNGYRTEALIETDVPDNFLAYAEFGAKQADQVSVKLRVLSSFRNTREFSEYNRQMLIDSVKMFLMENNLPMDQESYENALLLRSAGIKLSAVLLKILNQASLRNSEDFVQTMIGFMKKGMTLDTDFPDLFFEIRKVLRQLLTVTAESQARNGEAEPEKASAKSALENLYSVFSKVFGNGNDYRAFLLGRGDKDTLVQYRVRKHPGRERFYFELSDEETVEPKGLLVIDRDNDSYRINVFINPGLYRDAKEKLAEGRLSLLSSLQGRIPDRKLLLEFVEMKNEYAFWNDEEPETSPEGETNLFNLDISV